MPKQRPNLDNQIPWHHVFVDLRKRWMCGQHSSNCKSNFDILGQAFGTGGKGVTGVTGKDFARLWVEDRELAERYLVEDLKQPAAWAQQMGVI